MDKINILLVDDEALLRQGLKALMEKEPFVKVIYEASDEAEFTRQLSAHTIDVILLDIRLKNSSGVELAKKVRAVSEKSPKIIVVTGLDGVEVIIHLLKAGVNGIVYKLDGYTEIIKAIKAVLNSGSYFQGEVLRIIQSNSQRWDHTPPVVLSFQDKEILKGVAAGLTTKALAEQLKMSESTAETYRVRLMKKIGVPNTAALLAYAFRNGLL